MGVTERGWVYVSLVPLPSEADTQSSPSLHVPTPTHPRTAVTRSKRTQSPEASQRHQSPLTALAAFSRVHQDPAPNASLLERCQRKDPEEIRDGGGKRWGNSQPRQHTLPSAPHVSVLVAPLCSTLQYYLARLIALASFFPFRKFLFGGRGKKKKREPNSYGCSRHLATLSNPEPARNILTQVTLPELTPSSRHA